MSRLNKLLIITSVILLINFLTTCGIDEYFYLPQVPESNIPSGNISYKRIVIPLIPSDLYYAAGYNIYYRIYTSNENPSSIDETNLSAINSSLYSDFMAFKPIADPTTTTLPNANTFSSRKYYRLEFDKLNSTLPASGGVLEFLYPTNPGLYPVVTFTPNVGSATENITPLRTSGILLQPNDRMFSNTAELRYTTPEVNLDVSPGVAGSDLTYVSMYIVAYGTNPFNFSTIFSKPTHIGVSPFP